MGVLLDKRLDEIKKEKAKVSLRDGAKMSVFD